MKLRQIGSNQTELELNNEVLVLCSYATPVAALVDLGKGLERVKTNKFWSKTTSRHITSWLKPYDFREVDQAVLDELISNFKADVLHKDHQSI